MYETTTIVNFQHSGIQFIMPSVIRSMLKHLGRPAKDAGPVECLQLLAANLRCDSALAEEENEKQQVSETMIEQCL